MAGGGSSSSSPRTPGGGGRDNKGINEFFRFYSQLQHSCMYYSNLALRQMMVGYENPFGIGGRENGGGFPSVEKPLGKKGTVRVGGGSDDNGNFRTDVFCTPPGKKPVVKVLINGCDDSEEDTTSSAAAELGSPRQRKVNFATPLSTVKIKSPTPIHSMEELYGGHNLGSSEKTGFTSDSDEDGSDTDVICQYLWRVRNIQQQQQGQLQVPPANKKRKKRRKKRKSKNANLEENGYCNDFQGHWPLNTDEDYYDEDDPNAIYEVPLNEDDYEFISDIRLCGAPEETSHLKTSAASNPITKGGDGDGNIKRRDEMRFLYGDSGSTRILKMEETIENCFLQAVKNVNCRKY